MKIQSIILGMMLAVLAADAATITVTSTADSGTGTLRAALASAAIGAFEYIPASPQPLSNSIA